MKNPRPELPVLVAVALLLVPLTLPAHEGGESPENGLLTILAVAPGGPADTAGLTAGDRFLEMAGEPVASLDDLSKVTAKLQVGEEVEVTVERGGERLARRLALGEREGGVSLGISLAVMTPEGASEYMRAQTEGVDAAGCLAWVDETYRLPEVAAALELDLGDRAESLRACMRKDLDRMPARIPQDWCDNVFKVHCSGLDLLTELGEAQVAWCESALTNALGVDVGETRAWKGCAENKIFDRFSIEGSPSDAAACRAALDECGFDFVESGSR